MADPQFDELSAKQQGILRFLETFIAEHDYPPSIRDIQSGCDISSTSVVDYNLKRLEENLHRLGLGAATVATDAAAWQPPQPADAVLLDAPCSATGTLRRHPDIAWLKGPDQIAGLTEAQDRLLDAAVTMLKPGGLLVYAVCSLQPEEGPERIATLLERNDSMVRLPITEAELPGMAEALTAEGDFRSLPCHLASQGGLDGFYACRLMKR